MSKQITLQDAMSIKDTEGNASFLDLRFAVLNNMSQGWYSYDMLTAADGEITGVGSVLYRIQHFPQAGAYEGSIRTQEIVVDTKEVKIDDKRSIGYEIEDMDLAQIIAAPAIQATAASNLATAIKADKNARLFLKVDELLRANPEYTFYLPELVTEDDLEVNDYRSIQKKILVKRTKMSNIITNKYINVDPKLIFGIIAPIAQTNFEMLLTALNISTAAMDLLKYGIGGMSAGGTTASLGGTPFIVDPFIGKKVEQGASFNSDYTMDLSDYCGFMMVKDAIAYPSKWGKMGILPNPENLNTMVKAKWYTGFGVLRPELVCGIVKTLFCETEVDVAIGATHTISHSDVGNRKLTYTSSAENIATVKSGVVTGVAAGQATITIKDGENTLAEVAVTVA